MNNTEDAMADEKERRRKEYDRRLRFIALDMAVSSSVNDRHYTVTVERAKAFLEFLASKD